MRTAIPAGSDVAPTPAPRATGFDLPLLAQALAVQDVPPKLAKAYRACVTDPRRRPDELLLLARSLVLGTD